MAKGKGFGGPSSLMGSAPGTATQRQVGRKSDESNLIYAIIPGIRKKIASRLKSRLWACSFIPPILSLGTSNQVSRRGAETTVSAAAPLSAPVPLCRIYALRALAPSALRWTLRSTFSPSEVPSVCLRDRQSFLERRRPHRSPSRYRPTRPVSQTVSNNRKPIRGLSITSAR
jgi:hypothetical protein